MCIVSALPLWTEHLWSKHRFKTRSALQSIRCVLLWHLLIKAFSYFLDLFLLCRDSPFNHLSFLRISVVLDAYNYAHVFLISFCLDYTSLWAVSFCELTIYCGMESSFIYILHQSWKPSVSAFDSFLQQSQQYVLSFLYFFSLLWGLCVF